MWVAPSAFENLGEEYLIGTDFENLGEEYLIGTDFSETRLS